jgi:hypothetical protein
LLVFGQGRLAPDPATGSAGGASNVLMAIVLAMTYVGASNSVREIVKERSVLRREQNFGLSPGAYLTSKLIVLGAITLVQAAIVLRIGLARQDVGALDPLLLPSAWLELYVVVALCGLTAMAAGLLISAAVSSADKAMSLLPVFLFAQFLLAGVVFPVSGPGVQQLSWLAGSRWAFAGVASTSDVYASRRCGAGPTVADTCTSLWKHTPAALSLAAGCLLVLSALAVAWTLRLLARSDPARALARHIHHR